VGDLHEQRSPSAEEQSRLAIDPPAHAGGRKETVSTILRLDAGRARPRQNWSFNRRSSAKTATGSEASL
jgi:hypothetical protein